MRKQWAFSPYLLFCYKIKYFKYHIKIEFVKIRRKSSFKRKKSRLNCLFCQTTDIKNFYALWNNDWTIDFRDFATQTLIKMFNILLLSVRFCAMSLENIMIKHKKICVKEFFGGSTSQKNFYFTSDNSYWHSAIGLLISSFY